MLEINPISLLLFSLINYTTSKITFNFKFLFLINYIELMLEKTKNSIFSRIQYFLEVFLKRISKFC